MRPDFVNQHFSRREVLRAGLAGFSTLSLPALLRLRAEQEQRIERPARSSTRNSVILVWLRGGCSHLDTLDPKPDASDDIRSPYGPIATQTPGMFFTERLPRLAAMSNRFAVLRSMAHTGGGHPAGSLQMLGGDRDAADKVKPVLPDFMSVAHYLHYDPNSTLPNYIGVNPIHHYDSFQIAGPAYLGPSYEPFRVMGDPSSPRFEVPNIGMSDQARVAAMQDRLNLRDRLEGMIRTTERSGVADAMDAFEQQAIRLLTRPEARTAFDLTLEPDRVRDRYGRNAWGQQCLLARRLVEAGVEIVTTTFDGPLCGRVANWDDHAVNHHIFEALDFRLPTFDQAVSALIEDVFERGLDRRVLVVVTGEFGRTPRISREPSSGGGVASGAQGTVQPGRDHWPRACSMIWAGGGISGGQLIGATDRTGSDVVSRLIGPHDFLATIYTHLGIDINTAFTRDLTGRPIPVVNGGRPVPELVA